MKSKATIEKELAALRKELAEAEVKIIAEARPQILRRSAEWIDLTAQIVTLERVLQDDAK